MRPGPFAYLLVAAFFVPFALPGPSSPVRPAIADHSGDLVCPEDVAPVHDGFIQPREYLENFFDSTTKILAYFDCVADVDRIMHVALVSPWNEWTELRIQSAEAWNGDLNVVRTAMDGPMMMAEDGFMNGTTALYVDDLTAGGSYNVLDPAAKQSGNAFVYEFGLPLLSPDGYDCQLTGNGSFYFQLAYATVDTTHGGGSSLVESETHVLSIGQALRAGEATFVEVSLPQGSVAGDTSEVLVGLRDGADRPLAGKVVTAFAQTAFGFLDLGAVYTNDQGVATVDYAPLGAGDYLIGAAFAGGESHLASVAWVRLVVGPASPRSGPPGAELLWVNAIIVLALGGVWGTYGYSAYILQTAMRDPDSPGWLKRRKR